MKIKRNKNENLPGRCVVLCVSLKLKNYDRAKYCMSSEKKNV